VNFSNQIHDFDPGLTPNGVFWTVPVPKNSVYVHPGAGEAAVDVKNLAVQDFFSLPNFFTGGASAPAVVSFHIRWSGVTKRVKTRDVANGFAGEFIEIAGVVSPNGSFRVCLWPGKYFNKLLRRNGP
jgi:hypothetical protein